jgi:phosphatidylglycerophosphate synthase
MGRYRARDLLLVPSLLSLMRLPLAAGFVLLLNHPFVALGILLAGAVTDVLDGWYARRHDQVTATGAVVDPITDKLFVLTVVMALLSTERLSPFALLLLATREIGEMPLVLWWMLSRERRRARVEQPMANWPGKLATVAQFVTVASALFHAPFTWPLLIVTAVAGATAAIVYWQRELARVSRRVKSRRLPTGE